MNEKDIQKAAALRYEASRDEAPVVVAKGRGAAAERIVNLARENDVPQVQDRTLVEMLDQLSLNQAIPTGLYQAVAEVLVFVYRMNQAR